MHWSSLDHLDDHLDGAVASETLDPEYHVVLRRLEERLFDVPYEPPRVGRFAALKQLGAGAMGVVYLGYDDALDRKVALKLMRPRWSVAGEGRMLMAREARSMARLSHPNVVQVYEAGESSAGPFVAMEYVDGPTLGRWLSTTGRELGWRDRLDVLLGAARGLAAAHQAGIVHRDFKPENVFVSVEGIAKVGDFGLAGSTVPRSSRTTAESSVTRSGTEGMLGTPRYMSPEQWRARPATPQSDQFSFCVAAFEALYGRLPFVGRTGEEILASIERGSIVRVPASAVPRSIARVLRRGLSADPSRRFPSMDALVHALERRPPPPRAWPMAVMGLVWAVAHAEPYASEQHRDAAVDRSSAPFESAHDAETACTRRPHPATLGTPRQRRAPNPGETEPSARCADPARSKCANVRRGRGTPPPVTSNSTRRTRLDPAVASRSDDDLLDAWAQGDRVAARMLVERHFGALLRFFRNKVNEGVDDLVQETLLACVAGRERFRRDACFRTYMLATARNVLFGHYRRQRRREDPLDVSSRCVCDLDPSPSSVLARRAGQRVLLQALRRIPLDDQILVELFYWEKMKTPALAEVLGINEGAVRMRLHRARRAVKVQIERLRDVRPSELSTSADLEQWAGKVRQQVAVTA